MSDRDEIERLQAEVDTLTELVADALPKLVERLRLINEVAYLRAQLKHGNPPTNTLTPGDL